MDDQPSLLGRELGPYRVEAVIASGGMGTVYRGRHVVLGRQVAIKSLRPELAAHKSSIDRFFNEARAVNVICHENIVECTDLLREADGQVYMVMELLRGLTLAEALEQQGRFGAERAVHIAAQMAAALAAAHDKGIVHRDVKPGNVLLIHRAGSDDYVKVLDFGVARLRAGATVGEMEATQTGALVGTPLYMSPEQARGPEVGPGADVYALGAVLYHMLSGRPPFVGQSAIEVLTAHVCQPPEPFDAALEVPAPVAAVVMRALAKAPEARFASMVEMRAALLAAVGRPVSMRPTAGALDATFDALAETGAAEMVAPPPTAAERRGGRWRWWIGAVPVVAAAVAVALVGWLRAADDDEQTTRLNAAMVALTERTAPIGCGRRDAVLNAELAAAAELLAGGSPGSARPQDRQVADQLGAAEPRNAGAEYWTLLAKARLFAGDDADKVLDAADRALALCPTFVVPQAIAGTALFRADRLKAADWRLSRALDIDIDYTPARFNLALVAMALGYPESASDYLSEVLGKRPDDADALLARGQARLLAGKPAEALGDLEGVIRLTPDNRSAHFLLGEVLRAQGRNEAARRAYCRARDLGEARAATLCVATPTSPAP